MSHSAPQLAAACESCGKRLPARDAVICTNCGFDTRKGKRIETKMHRLQDRAKARRAARRSAGMLVRMAPWLFLLVQIAVSAGFMWIAVGDESARGLFVQYVFGHIALAAIAAFLWVIYEDGLIALFYPTILWMLALGDDANPWVESLMFGAAASFAAMFALSYLI